MKIINLELCFKIILIAWIWNETKIYPDLNMLIAKCLLRIKSNGSQGLHNSFCFGSFKYAYKIWSTGYNQPPTYLHMNYPSLFVYKKVNSNWPLGSYLFVLHGSTRAYETQKIGRSAWIYQCEPCIQLFLNLKCQKF